MILLQFLGAALMAGLLVFAFLWPWIAEEIITRKGEKKEEKSPYVYICHCEKCGYNGRISFARNGRYNEILRKNVWECPKCGEAIWQDRVKYTLREYAE